MSAPEYTLDELKAARDLKMKGDQESPGAPNEPYTLDELKAALALKQQSQPLDDELTNQIGAQLGMQSAGALGSQVAGHLIPEFLKQALAKTGLMTRPEQREFGERAGQGLAQSILSGTSGLSQLVGGPALPNTAVPPSKSLAGSLGSGIGQAAGYGAMLAPFVLGGEALIPGIAGELGGGVAGGLALAPTGERMEGGLEGAANVLGARAASKILPPLFKNIGVLRSKPSPSAPYKMIQDAHDLRLDHAQQNYDQIFNGIENALDTKRIPEFKLSNSVIERAREFGPQTREYKLMLNKAADGDFKAIRNLQSTLGKRARTFSGNIEKQDAADVLKEVRKDINNAVERHLLQNDMGEYASRLNIAGKDYADLMKTYHSKPIFSKLVGKEDREIPSTLSPLKKESVQTKRLHEKHPNLQKSIEDAEQYKLLQKEFKKLGKYGLFYLAGKGALKSYGGEE